VIELDVILLNFIALCPGVLPVAILTAIGGPTRKTDVTQQVTGMRMYADVLL
jgi:hypothetical protein